MYDKQQMIWTNLDKQVSRTYQYISYSKRHLSACTLTEPKTSQMHDFCDSSSASTS